MVRHVICSAIVLVWHSVSYAQADVVRDPSKAASQSVFRLLARCCRTLAQLWSCVADGTLPLAPLSGVKQSTGIGWP
jgi:hypothetical protein